MEEKVQTGVCSTPFCSNSGLFHPSMFYSSMFQTSSFHASIFYPIVSNTTQQGATTSRGEGGLWGVFYLVSYLRVEQEANTVSTSACTVPFCTPRPFGPFTTLHEFSPRFLDCKKRGVHKMTDVDVGEIGQQIIVVHPV